MPVLEPGRMMRSRQPTLLVENQLPAGSYRFQLIVVDEERNASAPAELTVRVVERGGGGRLPPLDRIDPIIRPPERPNPILRRPRRPPG